MQFVHILSNFKLIGLYVAVFCDFGLVCDSSGLARFFFCFFRLYSRFDVCFLASGLIFRGMANGARVGVSGELKFS